jgi:hypothetical protein
MGSQSKIAVSHSSKVVGCLGAKFWFGSSPYRMKSCGFFLNFHSTYHHDCDSERLKRLSYFGDIFSSLIELNLSLQGTSELAPKSILSLSGGFGPTTQRTQTAY